MAAHLTLDLAAHFPTDLRACLVLGMDEVCPCCGHFARREPVPVPEGLAPWKEVVVTTTFTDGDLVWDIDRDLSWTVPVAGVVGWGLVDPRGNLLCWQGFDGVLAPGQDLRLRK